MRMFSGLCVMVGVIALSLLAAMGIVGAQSEPPEVTVTRVTFDTASGRPQVTLYVSIIDRSSGAAVTGLTAERIQVEEDGVPVSAVSVSAEAVGAAAVVVLDSGGNIVNGKGVLGGKRWDDAVQLSDTCGQKGLVGELVDCYLIGPNDWVGMVGVAEVVTSVVPLNQNRDVRNAAYSMKPSDQPTPLRDGVSRAFELFDDPNAPTDLSMMSKTIIIFSDGIDLVSMGDLISNLNNQASREHITFYTIGLDSPDNTSAKTFSSSGLEDLAKYTEGVYVHHGSQEGRTEALDLFGRIASQSQQYQLAYPTHALRGSHRVCVRLIDSSEEPACAVFDSYLEMPTLSISASTSEIVKGQGDVTVSPTLAYPDNVSRPPKRIEYWVNGSHASSMETAPFEFRWNPSGLSTAGDYTIEARLYDSILPDTTFSASNSVKVRLIIPATETFNTWLGQNWLTLVLIPVVIVLGVVSIRMRRQIARGLKATTSKLRTVTQRLAPSKAKLVIIRGPNIGAEFMLTSQIVRIGRGEGLVDIVLTDPLVSNLHAVITEDQYGYSIADLYSSNGTFVNNVRLQPGPQPGQPGPSMLLQAGSVIRMGATEVRLDRIGGTTRRIGSF